MDEIIGRVTRTSQKTGRYGNYQGVTVKTDSGRKFWFADNDGVPLVEKDLVKVGYKDTDPKDDITFLKGAKIEEVNQVERPKAAPAPSAPAANFEMAGILALFEVAGEHLKHPKVRLQTPAGQTVALSKAGPRAKVPGSITVTDGQPYGNGFWYGRILEDGSFQASRDGEKVADLIDLLERFSKAPAEVAGEIGRLTGSCSFCRRRLEDERSTAVGYGKICADHFHLPWGVVVAREARIEQGQEYQAAKSENEIEIEAEEVIGSAI
jgi:hypothetical protein